MKLLLICLAMTATSSAFAKLTATEAFSKILKSGSYTGTSYNGNCTVDLAIASDNVSVKIAEKDNFQYFTLLNASATYSINEEKGEIGATVSTRFPKYSYGGTKSLFVREREDSVEFYISEVLLDHHGNDASTYTSCTIEK